MCTKGGAEVNILYMFIKPHDQDTSNMGIYLQIIKKPIVYSQKKNCTNLHLKDFI